MKKNYRLAVIGCGNMGEAIIAGAVQSRALEPQEIICFDRVAKKVEDLGDKYKVMSTGDLDSCLLQSDNILVCVKPQDISTLLIRIKPFTTDKLAISVAAGVRIERMEYMLGEDTRIARVMPSVLARVQRGFNLVTFNKNVRAEDRKFVTDLFSSTGKVACIDEYLFDAAMTISACGPALFYLFLESMIDAGVHVGLSRELATGLAYETFDGSGTLLSKSGIDHVSLKNSVISPGGTTASAIAVLERGSLRALIIDALFAAVDRAKHLEN
ncbi:MAG: pyrroline-5-carboxylate reductase [Actinobacteria bacterium]|nr:pyrroline-5-carboxylate reductase [Actinomycetota bacterium]